MDDHQRWGYERPSQWITRSDLDGRPDPEFMGDAGPWPMFVPAMWRAIADPTGAHAYPALSPDHLGGCAYWAPLTHLLLYSFGWRSSAAERADDRTVMGRGLKELLVSELIYLPNDPRLVFMLDVWGVEELEDFANWALAHGPKGSGQPDAPYRTDPGRRLAGGTDSLHLSAHWDAPRGRTVGASPTMTPDPTADPPHAALLTDSYAGWVTALDRAGNQLTAPATGRSWRVDVVAKRIGWLGTYRRSRETGLWFAGGHLLHMVGH